MVVCSESKNKEGNGENTKEHVKWENNGNSLREIAASLTACLACCSTGLVLGYGPVSLVSMSKDQELNLSDEMVSWIAGVGSLGGAIGSATCGAAMRRWGRKSALIYFCSLICLLGWGFIILAKPLIPIIGSFNAVLMIIVGRLFGGINMGSTMSVAAVYIIEAVSLGMIERLGPLPILTRTIFMVIGLALGSFMDWFSQAVLSAATVIPFMALSNLLPESPFWLVTVKKDVKAARKSLKTLRGRNYNEKELERLINQSSPDHKNESKSQTNEGSFWKMAAVSTGIMVCVQFSGASAFGAYTVQIFQELGPTIDPYVWSIIVGIISIVTPMVTVVLTKWFSSKKILLWSSAVFAISLYGFATHFYLLDLNTGYHSTWLPLGSITIYAIFYGIGYGSLLYSIAAAILPAHGRDLGSSIAVTTTWIFSFALLKTFFLLKSLLGMSGLYYSFAVSTSFTLVFMYVFIPDNIVGTKRLSTVSM